ncbi:MAG: hypothetical protein M0029_00765 [Actinomycetota bacterium]|jgi:hypothetical protein|nr:hypothetical protein [Actinomycetota bacterium]
MARRNQTVEPWTETGGGVPERRHGSGLHVLDAVLVAGAVVVAVVLAFAVLNVLAGLVWFAVKTVIVIAVIAAVVALLVRRRH